MIIFIKGLPASGKTTWAKQRVLDDKGKTKRVGKDDLRIMLDVGVYSRENEEFLLSIRDEIIKRTVTAGKNIIVDDTNLDLKHERRIREIAEELGVSVEVKFFDVHPDVCVARDVERPSSVGEKVIRTMYQRFLRK